MGWPEFLKAAERVRSEAGGMTDPLIVHHYDADGISSAAIAASFFISKGIRPRMRWIRKLDDDALEQLGGEREIVFTDLGGGNPNVNSLTGNAAIVDHHQTAGVEVPQANPMLFGLDGNGEMSAATTAFFVFGMRPDLGVVGAVGDMQAPFIGKNREMLEAGVREGAVRVERDLCFYGRHSRPLTQFLLYSDDPYVPGVSYREDNVAKLLEDLGIGLKDGERWRTYADLSETEKRKLVSAIAGLLMGRGVRKVEQLVSESYVLPKNDPASGLYEANEFSTVLNACGRHGKADLGVRICLGEKAAMEEGAKMLELHRRAIRTGIGFAESGTQDFGKFLFLDARGVVDEGIVGIVCGMRLNPTLRKPIIGIADGENGTIKASIRSPKSLPLNAGDVMKKAAEAAGGIGGGHRVAAGASIPAEKLDIFVRKAAETCDI